MPASVIASVGLYDIGRVAGTSIVEARALSRGFSVVLNGSVPGIRFPIRVMRTTRPYSWRLFAEALVSLGDGAGEPDHLDFVKVYGAEPTVADVLAIAFCYGKTDPLVTNFLIAQSDASLSYLTSKYSTLRREDVVQELSELAQVCADLREETDMLALLAQLYTPKSVLVKLERRLHTQQSRAAKAIAKRIAPFRKEIEAISQRHSDARSPGMSPSKRWIMKTWLEHYVEEHDQMPEGVHKVSISGPHDRMFDLGEIDFGQL